MNIKKTSILYNLMVNWLYVELKLDITFLWTFYVFFILIDIIPFLLNISTPCFYNEPEKFYKQKSLALESFPNFHLFNYDIFKSCKEKISKENSFMGKLVFLNCTRCFYSQYKYYNELLQHILLVCWFVVMNCFKLLFNVITVVMA